MTVIRSSSDLQSAIENLEVQRREQSEILKNQFSHTYQSLSAINILKGAFKEASASQDFKEHFVDTTVGLFAGYLSRILFIGKSNNPIKKFAGSILLFGIANFISKNPGMVGNIGRIAMKLMAKKL